MIEVLGTKTCNVSWPIDKAFERHQADKSGIERSREWLNTVYGPCRSELGCSLPICQSGPTALAVGHSA